MVNRIGLARAIVFVAVNLFFCNLLFAENCIQRPSFAMSPYKLECVEFDSICDIPKDWIKLNSCELSDITKGMHNVDASKVRDATIKMRDAYNGNGKDIPDVVHPKNSEKRTIPSGMRFYEQSDGE
jgi:hypothetical protein